MAEEMVPVWTVEAARLDERLKAQKEAVAVALASQKEAIIKAEMATDKRLEVLNELRGAMSDQAGKYVTRAELIGTVAAVAAIITIVMTLVTK